MISTMVTGLNNLNIQRKVIYYADYTLARTLVLLRPTDIFMDQLFNFFAKIIFQIRLQIWQNL